MDGLEARALDLADAVTAMADAMAARQLVPRYVHLEDGTPALPIVDGRTAELEGLAVVSTGVRGDKVLFDSTMRLGNGAPFVVPTHWARDGMPELLQVLFGAQGSYEA